MKTYEIEGYTGGLTKRKSTIFVAETDNGNWYVAEGGTVVNITYADIPEGTYIEELPDYNCFTVNEPISNLEEFEKAIND